MLLAFALARLQERSCERSFAMALVFNCHFGLGEEVVIIFGHFSHVLDVEFALYFTPGKVVISVAISVDSESSKQ